MKTRRQNDACANCELVLSCFAPSFSAENVLAINSLIQDSYCLSKHEVLYRQQEKFRGLFAVKNGGIKTFMINEEGEQIITGFFLPGELLGFDAVYSEHYIEEAVALTQSEICRIPFTGLLSLASQNSTIQKQLFKLFSQRINQARPHFHYNAEQKVAAFLLDYSERLRVQDQDPCNFHLLPTQQDIASYLNLTPETTSRVFHKFIASKVFQSDRSKQIQQLNLTLLERFIHSS